MRKPVSTTVKSLEGLTVEGQVENDVTEASGTQKSVDLPSQVLLVPGLGFRRRASDTPRALK